MSNEYSVWLMPEKKSEELEKLQSLISEYSREYGTPDFVPHVTLVGGLKISESRVMTEVSKLADKFESLKINFRGSHFSTTRHQCNYLLVEPEVNLLSMHKKIIERLGLEEDMYVPHLSLVYGDLELRDRTVLDEKIEDRKLPGGFTCSRIVVYGTSGDEDDWSLKKEFRLD